MRVHERRALWAVIGCTWLLTLSLHWQVMALRRTLAQADRERDAHHEGARDWAWANRDWRRDGGLDEAVERAARRTDERLAPRIRDITDAGLAVDGGRP